MTVFLGTEGKVELQRQAEASIEATVTPSDVEAESINRLSFDIIQGELITGDQVTITRTDGNAAGLDFFKNYSEKAIKKFVHVDEIGGIRFYNTFASAVTGKRNQAVELAVPASNVPILIEIANSESRDLGQVFRYELSTQKELADTTALGEEFRSKLGTLISGSGSMSCYWEYTGLQNDEVGNYLLELILRTKVGSRFKGFFYLKQAGYNPSGESNRANDAIWYETVGVLTSCSVNFGLNQTVNVEATFDTIGEIQLRVDLDVQSKILLESGGDILLEQDQNSALVRFDSDD